MRTTALAGAVAAVALWRLVSAAAALGCLAGSALMMLNFLLLALIGGAVTGVARGRGASRLALALAPLKMLLLMAVVYVLLARFTIDPPGFVAGILTLFAAILIEVWRTAPPAEVGARPHTEGNKV